MMLQKTIMLLQLTTGLDISQLAIISGFVSGVGAIVVSIITALSSASRQELAAVQKENKRLRYEADRAQVKLQDYQTWAWALAAQLRDAGLTPTPFVDNSQPREDVDKYERD